MKVAAPANILILTAIETDPHAVAVRTVLEHAGVAVRVLDPGRLGVTDGTLSYYLAQADSSRWIELDDERIDLDDVTSCWYRRPSPRAIQPDLDPDYHQVVLDEWKALTNALWSSLDHCYWVSRPASIRTAELKPLQLEAARAAGLTIPRTLFTSDPARARTFFNECGRRVIGKKIYSHGVTHGDQAMLFSSQLIELLSDKTFLHLERCPCIFQEYLPKAFDLRVTVIGDEVFAVRIDSQSLDAARVDYRLGQVESLLLDHTVHTLPPEVAVGCRQLVHSFGLAFGAIDLVLDERGDYVFLELNPNGQWLWLELLTGAPLSEAMARLLTEGAQHASSPVAV